MQIPRKRVYGGGKRPRIEPGESNIQTRKEPAKETMIPQSQNGLKTTGEQFKRETKQWY